MPAALSAWLCVAKCLFKATALVNAKSEVAQGKRFAALALAEALRAVS